MTCTHHWKIAPIDENAEVLPGYLELPAECRKCGASREFLAANPEIVWGRRPVMPKNPLRLPG